MPTMRLWSHRTFQKHHRNAPVLGRTPPNQRNIVVLARRSRITSQGSRDVRFHDPGLVVKNHQKLYHLFTFTLPGGGEGVAGFALDWAGLASTRLHSEAAARQAGLDWSDKVVERWVLKISCGIEIRIGEWSLPRRQGRRGEDGRRCE